MNVDYNIIRERSAFSSKANSRDSLVFSSTSSIPYHQYMKMNNNLTDIEIQDLIDSSQLSYKGNSEVGDSVSKMTDNPSLKKRQYV